MLIKLEVGHASIFLCTYILYILCLCQCNHLLCNVLIINATHIFFSLFMFVRIYIYIHIALGMFLFDFLPLTPAAVGKKGHLHL